MKKLFFFCLLFFGMMETSVFAQIVNIPDPNFKAALIAAGIDTNNDGEIQVAEALVDSALDVRNQQISSLQGIEAFQNLEILFCQYNLLTTLDITSLPKLVMLLCNNNQLQSLYVKNGVNNAMTSIMDMLDFRNNPNLQYICCDDVEYNWIIQKLATWGFSNVVVNHYCSFPTNGGTTHNHVTGDVRYDGNLNGCNTTDSALHYAKILSTHLTDTAYLFTNTSGVYHCYMDTGSYDFTPQIPNPSNFTVNPATFNAYFPNNNNNVQTQNICISPNSAFDDISLVIIHGKAKLGHWAGYNIYFQNKGTTPISGSIVFNFMGASMDLLYVNSNSPMSYTSTANAVTMNYNNLQPFETRIIYIGMNVLPSPTNNLGDILSFSANLPLASDINPSDNTFSFNQTIVAAYDPNDKTCLEGNLLPNAKIGEELHYLIRFQNTGTDYAEKVILVDSLDATKFEVGSIEVVETSHPAQIKVENNVLQFHFENIMLADSFTNEPESHGFALFKIKTKSTLPVNSTIKNKADIYFDFNPPIFTNVETTTFADVVNVTESQVLPSFSIYPNPAAHQLAIQCAKPNHFIIYNTLGEIMKTFSVVDKAILDISMLPAGLYWVGDGQGKSLKFVKE